MDENFWNTRYAQNEEVYGVYPNEYFKEKLDTLPPGKLLLPGEGEGRNAFYAARQGWQVKAFDRSTIAAAHAISKAKGVNIVIEYTVSDALNLPYHKEFYDAAALIYFHLPLAIRARIHTQISESIKKGGALILVGFGKSQLRYQSGGPTNKELLFDIDELKKEFTHIHWIEASNTVVNLKEGEGHHGKAHIVRLYGIKA